MEEQPGAGRQLPKWLKLFLKIAISLLCLWYVSKKTDLQQAASVIKTVDWFFLLPAILFFIISKLFSALRLNIYFKNINIHLPTWQNIRLYWLGMFYNLFLPGSISGDAYKVILLTKKYQVPYKKTTSAVLLDRVSGLTGLGLLLAVFSVFVLNENILVLLVVAASILGVILLFVINRYWLKDFLPSFTITLVWGLLVQLMQVFCVYMILEALNIRQNHSHYIFLFLVSSIVSVLPLTIGGLGIREIVFLEGSAYLDLRNEQAVVISLLFYLITLATSLYGLTYVFHAPMGEKQNR